MKQLQVTRHVTLQVNIKIDVVGGIKRSVLSLLADPMADPFRVNVLLFRRLIVL